MREFIILDAGKVFLIEFLSNLIAVTVVNLCNAQSRFHKTKLKTVYSIIRH